MCAKTSWRAPGSSTHVTPISVPGGGTGSRLGDLRLHLRRTEAGFAHRLLRLW
jgi:hypothetical protein